MRNKQNVEPATDEWEFEGIEPVETDRVVVLRKGPPPRKEQLMHAGVKEIRCSCCVRVQPIAEAEEFGEGWICGECLSDPADTARYGGLRGK